MASRVFRLSVLLTVIIRTAESSEADFGRSIAASAGGPSLAKSAPPTAPPSLPYTFAEQPADLVVRSRNATAELRCAAQVADDTASVTFWWSHDDVRIPLPDPSGRIKLLSRGDLLIQKVIRGKRPAPSHHRGDSGDHGDQGIYRCMIEGSVGTLRSQPARLSFASFSHNVTVKSTTEKVRRGGTARLECYSDSDPPAQFTWEKADGGEMPPNKFIQLPGGVLLITDVQPGDATDYRCVVYNNFLNRTRKSANFAISLEELSTDNSLKFLSAGQNLQLKTGENATLECSVEYATESVPIKWSFINKKAVKTVLTTNWTAKGVSILKLTNISLQNSGTYECLCGVQPDSQSQVTILNVSTPPVIVKKPQSITSPSAKTARFPCEAIGVPTPNVTFFKDGVPLKTHGRIKVRDVRAELVLVNTVKDDSGLYQCVAANEAGEVWTAALLTVNAIMIEPPTNLTCSPGDEPDSINLSWTEPASTNQKVKNQRVQKTVYTIHYIPSDGGEEKTSVIPTSYGSVMDLRPYTNYSFYVRSYTSGASEPSPKVICQTEESVPTDIPHLTIHLTGSNKVLVSWEPLPPSKANGVITEYKVIWRRENNRQSINNASVPGNTTEYIIEGLEPGRKYDIRVLPGTRKGFLVPSSSRHNWTSVEMPIFDGEESTAVPVNVTSPDALSESRTSPVLLELQAATPYSINVSWTSPEPIPKYYSVYYCLLHSKNFSSPSQFNESASKTVWSNATSAQLFGLSPDSVYGVKVKAFYDDGQDGPTSNLLECITLPDSLDIHWDIINDTTVKIYWKEPDVLNGTLKGYNVTFATGFDKVKIYKSVFLIENETSVLVDGLTPNVEYVVRVDVMVTVGTGPSSLVRFTTQESDGLAEFGLLLLKVVPAVLCVLACGAYSIYRCRCSKSPNAAHLDNVAVVGAAATAARLGKHYGVAGQANHVNGGSNRRDVVFGSKTAVGHKTNAEAHEMALLSPPIPSSFSSSAAPIPPAPIPPAPAACHIDSKGAPGYVPEDPFNAVTVPLLNGCTAPTINIHITENPQFDSWVKTSRPNVNQEATSCTESATLLPHSHSLKTTGSETSGSDTADRETGGSDAEQPYEENENDLLNETQYTDVENSFQLHHNNNRSTDDTKLPSKRTLNSPPFNFPSESKTTFKVGDILSSSG